ncbi:FAD-dependent oxidoreductase [Desulforhopalus singaporensis]|uniref:Putative adenylylsulfate reductase-associated electron transfer protein QmoA n=1 Tax=Desulforhopalus singaporensis TaxID=91360 RepID=A0A1H0R941_9BACT|nr:FAD-dependent oxidoreductase [Desulforhopalus singaporensis]SDP25991.1 putative adenylylsulfate reductase-associated electron transfer protein QmoA [Desulforhopalus singaporensis]
MTDEQSTTGAVLVVGGGISGLTAALEAAEVGKDVFLVEKGASFGGRVAQLNQYFPKLCPPSCGLEINFRRVRDNRRIRTYSMTTVKSVSGAQGNYEVTLETAPRYVNSNCTACGDCSAACPDERDNDFNFGMDKTKAAYLPHEMAFPRRYVIDKNALSAAGAEAVKSACKYDAIDLDMQAQTRTINVASIVWATGWTPYDATKMENLKFGQSQSIVTNMMIERMAAPSGPTGGKIVRPGDDKEIESIAFVQCAGSRDENHLEYCSHICCMATFKQMSYVREQYPDAKIYVFYIDLRTPGKYEKFREARMADENATFIKGKVADIAIEADGSVTVTAENALTAEKISQQVDMAVLATGMQPNFAIEQAPADLQIDSNGFVISDPNSAMISAGCAKKAADVVTCTQSSTAAALKAIQVSRR